MEKQKIIDRFNICGIPHAIVESNITPNEYDLARVLGDALIPMWHAKTIKDAREIAFIRIKNDMPF